MRKTLAAAAAVIGLAAFAAPASAAVNMYQFNLDGTTGSSLTNGPWGTVSVDDNGGTSKFSFDVLLGTGPTDSNSVYFNDSKAFQAFDMLLGGTGITFQNITPGFTSQGPGTYSAPNIIVPSDTHQFNYSFLCADICAGGKVDDLVRELKFDVLGTNLSVLAITDAKNYKGTSIYFGADIAQTGNTGNIGATLISSVPEPATWALFILGFGFVGTMLRSARTRQGASLIA